MKSPPTNLWKKNEGICNQCRGHDVYMQSRYMVILARQLAACFAWSRTYSSIYTCTCTYSYIIDHYGRPENESDRSLLCYAIRDREAYATIGCISACAHNVFSHRRQPISVFRPIIPRRLAHLSIWAHLFFFYYCTESTLQ